MKHVINLSMKPLKANLIAQCIYHARLMEKIGMEKTGGTTLYFQRTVPLHAILGDDQKDAPFYEYVDSDFSPIMPDKVQIIGYTRHHRDETEWVRGGVTLEWAVYSFPRMWEAVEELLQGDPLLMEAHELMASEGWIPPL